MRRPFVVRVQNDDPGIARPIARALVQPLQARGARVVMDGQSMGGGTDFAVHVLSVARGLKGTTVTIGVMDPELGARWLAPIEVPADPAQAASAVETFLERWGFIPAIAPSPSGSQGLAS